MKLTFTLLISWLTAAFAFSQGLPLPYYTGFDSPAERAGWVEYRTGFISAYGWNDINTLSHDYNVGGNPNDTVIDWFVSPPLNFTSQVEITLKVWTAGFSSPIPDNCQIWYGINNPDPATGIFFPIANLSYMVPQYQWLDTTIICPFTSDSAYIAFRYKTIGAAWMTYQIDSITITSNVGISENNNGNNSFIKIFPEPLSTTGNIRFNHAMNNACIDIYNSCGQKLKTISHISGEQVKINRDGLPAGYYFMHVMEGDKIISINKLIIAD